MFRNSTKRHENTLFIQMNLRYLVFLLVGTFNGHRRWLHPDKTELTTNNRTSSSPSWNTRYLFVPRSSAHPWRRLDKTGAVGGMVPSSSHLSAGWGPPYRPLRLAGDVQAGLQLTNEQNPAEPMSSVGSCQTLSASICSGCETYIYPPLKCLSGHLSFCQLVWVCLYIHLNAWLSFLCLLILCHLRLVLTYHSCFQGWEQASYYKLNLIVRHFGETHLFKLNEKIDTLLISVH